MFHEHRPDYFPATVEQILALLDHEQARAWNPRLLGERPRLTLNSTITDWTESYDTYPFTDDLGKFLNRLFDVKISRRAWRQVLTPRGERTLREVCGLLALYAMLPRVRPVKFFGKPCITAGAFLHVGTMLADAGADVGNVAPSTPLREFTRRYPRVFTGPISRLAVGLLPEPDVRSPLDSFLLLLVPAIFVTWICLLAATTISCSFVLPSLVLMVASIAAIWLISRIIRPRSVTFEGLVTFRDLSEAIASKRPAQL